MSSLRMADGEVLTERTIAGAGEWVSRVVGGRFDGLSWSSKDERQAIDRHVALVALLRTWEDACER
jgi:hypothetical protein